MKFPLNLYLIFTNILCTVLATQDNNKVLKMKHIGSLIVVGTGIQVAGDITVRARAQISQADIVFYVVPDKISKQWLGTLNSNLVDLSELYSEEKSRLVTYNEMTAAIVNAVKNGHRVCAAFYGHPGVFVYASHKAIEQLKELGYHAVMEPGISAEDCLFADVGIDPAKTGCLSMEATQFLFYKRNFDPHALIVLWQIGLIGDHTLKVSQTNQYHYSLEILTNYLLKYYPPQHQVIIYEAATIAILPARIEYRSLSDLPSANLTAISTLVIPPAHEAQLNGEILEKLGITETEIKKVLSE